MGGKLALKICDDCGSKTRRHRVTLDKRFVCFKCSRKYITEMPRRLSLNNALDKVYTIHAHLHGKEKSPYGYCNFPPVLIGRKFKVVLVEEDDSKNTKKMQGVRKGNK